MAVIHLFGPLSLIWRYWRISLADFIACMVAFWVTIFVSAEIGIGAAAGWSVAWTLLRSAFAKPKIQTSGATTTTTTTTTTATAAAGDSSFGSIPRVGTTTTESVAGPALPEDTTLVRFTDSLFFPNANRNKVAALEAIQLVYPSVQNPHYRADAERSWSVAAERRLERLRALRGVVSMLACLPSYRLPSLSLLSFL